MKLERPQTANAYDTKFQFLQENNGKALDNELNNKNERLIENLRPKTADPVNL